MTYEAALTKAWEELQKLSGSGRQTIEFLGETYKIDAENRRVTSICAKETTKDHLTILLLHYLIGVHRGPVVPSGEWISFKDIDGGAIYYPAFREASIEPIIGKYGSKPSALIDLLGRFNGKKIEAGDAGIELAVFKDLPVRIVLWKGDEEFSPEATILFDKSITKIFSTEDITVLSRLIAHRL